LQRQYAAKHYIEFMAAGRTIINVDESIITLTENRKRSWLVKGVQSKATIPRRPGQLNIIAGVSSQNRFYFTVNRGKNNGYCFVLFLVKLCEQLDEENNNWRLNTIVIIDNAGYHKSKYVREKVQQLKIPLMFLGPYQFRLAPIEIFFS